MGVLSIVRVVAFYAISLRCFALCDNFDKIICATLFNNDSQKGEKYLMSNGASVSNFDEAHITAHSVWNSTLSFSIEKNCKLKACTDADFNGICREFSQSQDILPEEFETILSASCHCSRSCSCSDIQMRRTSCAHGYFEGCDVCDAPYTDLKGEKPSVVHDGKITAIKVREGCHLSIYSEEDYEGDESYIDSPYQLWNQPIGSYQCSCTNDPITIKPPRPADYPALVDVPYSISNVSLMVNGEFKRHPGLLSALESLKNKRSSKNVYILALGSTGAGKSSAINLLFDNPNVTRVGGRESITTDIHEFRISVPVDELGIQNSELRIIDTPGLVDTRGLHQDAKFLATLDEYLSNHEELHERMPNIVLIFHKFNDNRFAGEGSLFVKMLRGLDAFTKRITDENYSNVIFVFSHLMSEETEIHKKPKQRLLQFKTVIEDYSLFPKPIVTIVAENKPEAWALPSVNGYFKLPNGDFYPRNLFEKIQDATMKGGDRIGDAVIRTAFRDPDNFNITSITFKLVESSNNKISKYYNILAGAIFNVENTEISRMLAEAHTNMSTTLKRKFPHSLLFMQKALNIRNIRIKADIPQTTLDILDLLSNLQHNEANTFLLAEGLKIKPPVFGHNVLSGHSYNVFKDIPLNRSPFELGKKIHSDIGYLLPSAMTCNVENQASDFVRFFSSKSEYLVDRLSSFGIQGKIPENEFSGETKSGFNIQTEAFRNDGCEITAVREFRTFELILNDKPPLTSQFISTLQGLPSFNSSDPESVRIWNDFFEDYGTHVVSSVHGGGAIEVHLKSNQICKTEMGKALLDVVQFVEDLNVVNDNSSSLFQREGVQYALKFRGGDPAYHTSDMAKMTLDDASRLLSNWKKSLRMNPVILTSEIKLLPLSIVARKVGQKQNISLEIERATLLRFNSTLRYIPAKKPSEMIPGLPREETPILESSREFDKLFTLLLNQQQASEKRFELLITEMKEHQKAAEKRREEERKEELEWRRKMEEERQKERHLAQEEREKNEKERQRLLDEFMTKQAERERATALEREKLNKEHASMLQQINENHERRMIEISNRPAPKRSCLKEGTAILLEDGTGKAVEEIQIGDVILDHELKSTRVIGIAYEFLMAQTFYGFTENSFFFTESHIFVGPSKNHENGVQLYAKDLDVVFNENPLMEKLNMLQMNESEPFEIYFWQESNHTQESKNVQVYKDSAIHPEDTKIYFLQVDSPSGTYFANGYVCRHEIPPIQFWPNTMALLFQLFLSHPASKILERVPYTMEISSRLISAVSEIETEVKQTLGYLKENLHLLNQNETRIDLQNVDVDAAIISVFNEPTMGKIATRIYSTTSRMISKYLDSEDQKFELYIGDMQRKIIKAMYDQSTASFEKYFHEFGNLNTTQL